MRSHERRRGVPTSVVVEAGDRRRSDGAGVVAEPALEPLAIVGLTQGARTNRGGAAGEASGARGAPRQHARLELARLFPSCLMRKLATARGDTGGGKDATDHLSSDRQPVDMVRHATPTFTHVHPSLMW